MKPKTFAVVADGHWDQLQGGAEYQLDLLARELAARGHRVHYVFADRGTPLRQSPVVHHPLKLPELLRKVLYPSHALLWRQLYSTLNRIRPDVIINRVGNGLTGLCAHYGKRRGVRTLWHVANITDLLPWSPPRDRTVFMARLDRKLLNYGIRNVNLIVAQAEYQDAMLRERFGRRTDLVVPNFHPLPEAPVKDSPTLDVVWVANIKPKKQPEAFIALAKALKDMQGVRFIMIGRPSETGYQRKIDELLREATRVDYRGELDIGEVNRILSKAAVFVNTSVFEGFPNTFVQAWLNELPVISLQFDPDDVLKRQGLGSHSGNLERMICDVRSLLCNETERARLGQHARSYAIETHSVGRNVDRIEMLVEETAS